MIRHTITDLIDRSEGEVIWRTYTLFIESSSNKIASFILYQLTHGLLYQLFRGMAELKSFLICIIEVYDDSFHQPRKAIIRKSSNLLCNKFMDGSKYRRY